MLDGFAPSIRCRLTNSFSANRSALSEEPMMRLNSQVLTLLVLLAAGFVSARAGETSSSDSRRPPAIAAAGVPPIPDELWETLSKYENVRSASFAGWSPDGEGILIQTRFGNSAQLHRVYEPGGRREQITFFEEPAGGTFIRKAQDGSLLVTLSRGGNENDQVYLLDRDEYETTLITDGKSRNLLGPFTHDGSKVIIHSNRRNGRDTDVYVADPRKPDSMSLLYEADSEFWTATDWSRDDSRLLMLRYVSANESYPAIFDVASRKLEMLPTASDDKASYDALTFSPDGKTVYMSTDARGEFSQLARLKLETGKYEWLSEDIKWDVADIEVEPESGLLAFSVNENGASRVFLLEGKNRRELRLPLGIVTGLEFSPDGKKLGFTLASPAAPAEAYSIDVAGENLTRWTYSEAGGLDPKSFVEPRRIKYKSFDKREIPAYYFAPRDASPKNRVPVVVEIHGGPESQYRPYFSPATQYFVTQMGMAVIAPNVRGSSGYGKTYLKLDNAENREDSVKDIGALLDWIKQQPELDSSRVAVIGGSYGGYMVLSSLLNYPDRIRAGVDMVGIANFITFLENTAPYRQDLRRAEYGDERDPEMRKVFERINPTSHADKIRSALLVAHGKNDPRVPFSEAQQIAERVRAQGRTVWTVYAENEGHGFGKKDNRDYLRAVIAMFLKEQLGVKRDAKAESQAKL